MRQKRVSKAESEQFWNRLLSFKAETNLHWQWFSWHLGETAATLSTWASCRRPPAVAVVERFNLLMDAIESGSDPDKLKPMSHFIRIAVPIEKVGLCACGCGRLIVRGLGAWNRRYWDRECRKNHRKRVLTKS